MGDATHSTALRVEDRVLVLTPSERDAVICRDILAEVGVCVKHCFNLASLCEELKVGAGAAVVTGEAVALDASGILPDIIRSQPPWSDLPIIVLATGGSDGPAAALAMEMLGNVTLLDRPVRVATLVSAVRAALRGRRKQYEVRDHLIERQAIAERLKDEARRKDEFLAMLAHELRNPLAPIRNAAEIIRLAGISEGPVGKARDMIERQVNHVVRLVDDLLDVSRISHGKVELRLERFDLTALVARSGTAAQPGLEKRQHHLTVELHPEPLVIEADSDRIAQVLSNLLSNAGKYTPPGGRICLSVDREGPSARVMVKDNGIGIRPEYAPRLFEMFSQSDRVPGRVSEGLGLGLSLVKSLTELHGGTVSAFSNGPGQGSEFVVRLPLFRANDSPTSNGSHKPTPTTPPSNLLRILVVDDNVDGAESLSELLELAGHTVRCCHDGPSALKLMPTYEPNVILLDIGLPGGMDGYEVARRVRAGGWHTPILIALTGYGQKEDHRRSADAGFRAHVVKPLDPKVLSDILAEVQAGFAQ